MDRISLPPRALALRLTTGAALAATLLAAGCANEAGSQITAPSFGNATMNNHLVQTCQAGPGTAQGKYIAGVGGCPGRNWDGQYAQVTYDGYVADAVAEPDIITFGAARGQ